MTTDNGTSFLILADIGTKQTGNPPMPLPSDYVLIAVLVVLFIMGSPVNLVAFAHLHQSSGKSSMFAAYFAKSPLYLLKVHLNLTDLMVLFVYATCKICWLITYQWRGGEFLCKFMQFANSTAFQVSSNVVICIAFDRVLVVLYKRRTPQVCRTVRQSIGLAWTSAVFFNLPQLFTWTVITPYPSHPTWQQCVTVGFSKRLELRNAMILAPNVTYHQNLPFSMVFEKAYNVFHFVVIFWVPLVFIVVCYVVVAYHLHRLSTNQDKVIGNKKYMGVGGAKCDPQVPLHHYPLHTKISKNEACYCNSDCNTTSHLSTTDPDAVDRRFSEATDISSTAALIVSKELKLAKNKTIKTNLLVVVAYVLCWLPYNVLTVWHWLDPVSFKPLENSVRFAYHLIVLNSVINPFLYGMITLTFNENSILKSS